MTDPKPEKAVFIIHDTDNDGQCAATVLSMHLSRVGLRCVLVPWGREPGTPHYLTRVEAFEHDPASREFAFVDCRPSDEELVGDKALLREPVTIFDHHRWASREATLVSRRSLPGGAQCTVIHNEQASSAALLVWRATHATVPLPPVVAYVDDHDSWQHRLWRSKDVNAWLYAETITATTWERLNRILGASTWDISARTELERLLDPWAMSRAAACRAAVESSWEAGLAYTLDGGATVATLPARVVSASYLHSEVASALLDAFPEAGVAVVVRGVGPGLSRVSLRARTDDGTVDLTEVAAAHGGGGHRTAAGFVILNARLDALLVAPGSISPVLGEVESMELPLSCSEEPEEPAEDTAAEPAQVAPPTSKRRSGHPKAPFGDPSDVVPVVGPHSVGR